MDIRNIPGAGQPIPIQPQADRAPKTNNPPAAVDQVAISDAGRQAVFVGGLARQALGLPDSRPDVVAAARRALESGELDSPAAFLATARAIRPAR
jgi:hypothetical protein